MIAWRRDYSLLGPTKAPPEVDQPLRVAIVPTPGFTLMPLACFVDFLRLAGDESDYSRKIYCTWEVLSHDMEPVYSSCGIAIHPHKSFGRPQDYDYIVVHGGILHGDTSPSEALYQFILAAAEANVTIVGSCSGSFVLAEVGLLSGRRCAVHFALANTLRIHFPDVIPVTDAPVVSDGRVITSPGGLAAMSLAKFIVADACGDSRAHKSLHYLLGDDAFEKANIAGHLEVGLQCTDRRVANAIGLMRQKMYELCPISEIADTVGTSERELSRLFKKHLEASPARYWREMRLRAARWMLLNSDRSIAQVAYECGFADSAHFVHWFKRIYNATPAKLRKVHREFGLR
jgi:transcriptional regulator GlxA family with amidase domain